jgi:hypothetical protein
MPPDFNPANLSKVGSVALGLFNEFGKDDQYDTVGIDACMDGLTADAAFKAEFLRKCEPPIGVEEYPGPPVLHVEGIDAGKRRLVCKVGPEQHIAVVDA